MLFSFLKKKNPIPTTASEPSTGIKKTILRQLAPNGLSSLPTNAKLLFDLSTNPDAEFKEILPLLEQDEAMTARILKVANSAYFNRGKTVNNVNQAVGVIGLQELCSLLSCISLAAVFPSSHSIRKTLWSHNVTTATITKLLAERYNLYSPGTAFTAGLLHDLGKLLIAQKFPNEYQQIYTQYQNSNTPSIEKEQDKFPFNHTEVGYVIGEKWSLPKAILNPILRHHQPWEELGNDKLTKTVKLANILAHIFIKEHALDLYIDEIKKALMVLEIKEVPQEITKIILKETRHLLDVYA
jgi:putative nucleotidyltransferase with HDIG domain